MHLITFLSQQILYQERTIACHCVSCYSLILFSNLKKLDLNPPAECFSHSMPLFLYLLNLVITFWACPFLLRTISHAFSMLSIPKLGERFYLCTIKNRSNTLPSFHFYETRGEGKSGVFAVYAIEKTTTVPYPESGSFCRIIFWFFVLQWRWFMAWKILLINGDQKEINLLSLWKRLETPQGHCLLGYTTRRRVLIYLTGNLIYQVSRWVFVVGRYT